MNIIDITPYQGKAKAECNIKDILQVQARFNWFYPTKLKSFDVLPYMVDCLER